MSEEASHHISCPQAASEKGDIAALKRLLQAGARVNTGQSCLLEPCRQGRADVVALLLEAGEDPAIAGEGWESPLLLAKVGGHQDIVDLLKEHKLEVTFNFIS